MLMMLHAGACLHANACCMGISCMLLHGMLHDAKTRPSHEISFGKAV
jgi:hypothetical protein